MQPTESQIVTATTIAEPLKVTCIQLDPEENATVVLRSNATVDVNNGIAAGFAQEASTKDIPAKHYERLIEELKCPGCALPMKSPIYLCKTGHSICEQCTRILLMCPLCKEGYTNIRSLTVEALCSKAHFKCSNASGGCTVRLQHDLLSWHEKQCIYKPMKCFMGRVWGNCQWNGREAFWKEHLEAEHAEKIFTKDSVDLTWNMGVKQKPLTGYYVFEVFNEMFNFYEIYDKDRILFTMTCTSTQKEKKLQFAYEVTLFNEDFEALAVTQKFPVHSEYDADILAEGTCVSFPISDLTKFLDEEKLLHYRVRVLEVKTPRKSRTWRSVSPNGKLPIDFQQTNIQGVNLKNVPSDVIVTRRLDDIPYADTESTISESVGGGISSEDELEKSKREFYAKLEAKKKRDSGSDTDPEFEAFIAKKWGTPQLHFNRKYLKGNATSSDASSSDDSPKSPKMANDDKISITSTSYKKRMSNTLRKSFRSLKTDLIEMKPFGKKSSPEKKLM
ncbi:E3 ubiquitin-protein ligase Siah2-like [Musca vetustissima]|uniref:E3 ubiquitin-protein ligase Siah2-like n=1 Tax=Musca vetustissima TaxID=27455 RepID=UPI002AB649CE|nr:E3 ubiquitin-protein ligase Siah2-like [Musca vetustissima]